MNDWYGNNVSFNGNERNVPEVLAFFKDIIYNRSGELTAYGDFRNFSFLNDGRVSFESKGDPGIDALKEVAGHFQVDFLLRFASQDSYGEAYSINGDLDVLVLDEEEMRLPGYDKKRGVYTFENLDFETHSGTLDYILEQKRSKIMEENDPKQFRSGFRR
jgi:hypothetical protein